MEHRLTEGHVARHVPPASAIGREVALLDVAQDFLLTHLHQEGFFDLAVFKGGTALRKLFAGPAGRFSTDIDLALASPDGDRDAVAALAAELTDGRQLGPFQFATEDHRGRWRIHVQSDFGDVPIPLKLDVGPPCWLVPEHRSFVQSPVHRRYDFELPALPTMRLEENLAEKVARLNRLSPARDASDLVWAATTPPHSLTDRAAVRRLAVLKVWADTNGLDGHWRPADRAGAFDPARWLSTGREWDDETIGLLAHPPPATVTLEADLVRHWAELGNLDDVEAQIAEARDQDRRLVVADLLVDGGDVLGETVDEHVDVGEVLPQDHDHFLRAAETEGRDEDPSSPVDDGLHGADEALLLSVPLPVAVLAVGRLDDEQIGFGNQPFGQMRRRDGQVLVVDAADVAGDDDPLVAGCDDDAGCTEDVTCGEQSEAKVADGEGTVERLILEAFLGPFHLGWPVQRGNGAQAVVRFGELAVHDLGGVGPHGGQEVPCGVGAEDGNVVEPVDERSDVAGVVVVGVGDDDCIEPVTVEDLLDVLRSSAVRVQAGVDEQAVASSFDEDRRPANLFAAAERRHGEFE